MSANWNKEINYDLDGIIAMDETTVWHEMNSNTIVTGKGAKSVVLKTTGHEKKKSNCYVGY